MRTASDEEPAPPNGPQRPHPGSPQQAGGVAAPAAQHPQPSAGKVYSEAMGGLTPLGGVLARPQEQCSLVWPLAAGFAMAESRVALLSQI